MKILTKIAAVLFSTVLLSCSKDVTVGETSIIPNPQKLEVKQGQFIIDNSLAIGVSDPKLMPAAEFLQGLIAKSTGIKAPISEKGTITLGLDSSKVNNEAYTLNVSENSVEIIGGGYGGVLYGIESLRHLMPKEIEAENGAANLTLAVNAVTIEDSPEYEWRGFMLDVSRHFYSPDEIKTFLDMMAYYKMNKFHWHLTDDQGWRIEIKKYPLLTEKGAWREFNNQDRGCMERSVTEDNKDLVIDPAKLKINGTDTLYGGFYTQNDIKELVAYASNLNIDIIPEIDMPGHILAAVENYKGVSCSDEIGWGALFSSPVCPGKDHALEFCKDIYSEIFELFPYEYVHLGADEVDKSNWEKCPDCQARMRANGLKNEHELQAWFVKYMEKHFNDNGRKLLGWDEIIEGGLSETATVMWWRSWEKDAIPVATSQGNKVVFSPNANMYLDYAQDKNSVPNIYMYTPTVDGLTPEQEQLIMGVQANLWCEWVPSMDRAEYMAFPRLLALAETGWCAPETKNLEDFYERMICNMQKLDIMGINYRPLDITDFKSTYAFTSPTEFEVNIAQKDVYVRYTTDGSIPNENSTRYTAPIKIDKNTNLNIRTYRPNDTAADFVSTQIIIEDYAKPAQNAAFKGDGLTAKWYDYAGNNCKDITTAKLNKEFTVSEVCIPEGASGNIGLITEGYFEVANDDIYTFKLNSDDGSKLFIGENLVVDNGGPHGPREVIGQKPLAKGVHKFKVEYFDHNGGILSLEVLDSKGNTISNKDLNFKH